MTWTDQPFKTRDRAKTDKNQIKRKHKYLGFGEELHLLPCMNQDFEKLQLSLEMHSTGHLAVERRNTYRNPCRYKVDELS